MFKTTFFFPVGCYRCQWAGGEDKLPHNYVPKSRGTASNSSKYAGHFKFMLPMKAWELYIGGCRVCGSSSIVWSMKHVISLWKLSMIFLLPEDDVCLHHHTSKGSTVESYWRRLASSTTQIKWGLKWMEYYSILSRKMIIYSGDKKVSLVVSNLGLLIDCHMSPTYGAGLSWPALGIIISLSKREGYQFAPRSER